MSPSENRFNQVPPQYRSEVDALYRLYRNEEPRALVVGKTTLIGCSFHGLFAGRSFRQGDLVCVYSGTTLPTKAAIQLEDKSYLMRLGEQNYVDAKHHPDVLARYASRSFEGYADKSWLTSRVCLGPLRYINDCIVKEGHNVIFEKQPENNRALVRALRDIAVGEEIFVDYGKWYWAGSKPTGKLRLSNELLWRHPQTFDLKLIESNLRYLNKRVILESQRLTLLFCVKYILPGNDGIDVADVVRWQPHISLKDLITAWVTFRQQLCK